MKNTILVLALSMVTMSAFANEELKSDRSAVNSSCTQDAQTAGCGNEVVGKGLLKCLHGYKKAHKDFKFSDSCKDAMKKLRADRKEEKSEKK